VFVSSNLDSVQRYCVTGSPIASTNNENTTAFINGVIETNTESDTISYTLYYADMSVILSIVVMGPIDPLTQIGTPYFYLCGVAASGPGCIPTSGGYLNATRLTVYVPVDSAEDPNSFILNLRSTPWLYYAQVNTAASPDGAFRMPFVSICGTP
jgi:hypothetical protein